MRLLGSLFRSGSICFDGAKRAAWAFGVQNRLLAGWIETDFFIGIDTDFCFRL